MKSPISILTWLCLLFLASCISNKKTSLEAFKQDVYTPEYATGFKILGADNTASRSEERRVGKECRSRWSPYH